MASGTAPGVKANVLCVTTYELGDESASTRVLNVAGALREQGYGVTVHQHVCRRTPTSRVDLVNTGDGITRRVIVSSRPASFFRHLVWVAREKYDVVIGNNMNGALFSLLGRLKAPLVLDLHGDMVAELDMDFPDSTRRPPFRFQVRRSFYELTEFVTRKFSDRISCVSRKMISVLRERGVPDNRLLYVPNCVDLDFFRPQYGSNVGELRSRMGIGRDKLVLGYLGRVHPWQGVEKFIEAARAVSDPGLAFLVVGTGESSTEGNLHFAGEAPMSRMPEYYSVCDAFVLPRPSHPATEVAAPTKFAEYAAMGKPIIATEVGDAADLIRQYNCGVVVNDNSPAELIRGFHHMRRLAADERSAMGKEARRLAETEFTLDIAKENLSRCIDELTTGST